MPSLPYIPIPIFAFNIIETSFAPSPIDIVTHDPLFLKTSTMSAFYFGETLQHKTDFATRDR